MAEESEIKAATIRAPGRRRDVTVGVNGEVKKFPVNVETPLADYQIGALENAGYNVIVSDDGAASGDEGSPSDAVTGESDSLDHDGDGEKGGSTPKDPPALTGKTTAELNKIAEDEGLVFGDDVKTNADRIKAIEAARAKDA